MIDELAEVREHHRSRGYAIERLLVLREELYEARYEAQEALDEIAGWAHKLRELGVSVSETARIAGISRPTMYRLLKAEQDRHGPS